MRTGASITIDPVEFAEQRDPWILASDMLSRRLLPEIQRAFPDGCHIEAGSAEWRYREAIPQIFDFGSDQIIVRLEVNKGDAQPDLPTLQSRIRELLIASFKSPVRPAY
jgi:hypothetical protein